MMESFDDRKLINLARYHWYSQKSENRPEDIDALFGKEKLSNTERNKLLGFIEESKYNKPVSMAEMKRRIFEIIGYKDEHSSGYYVTNTVNRAELEAIYNFIKENQESK